MSLGTGIPKFYARFFIDTTILIFINRTNNSFQSVRDIETDSVDMSQYEYVTEKAHRWKIDLLFYNADKKTINSCLHLHILIEKKTKKERQRDNKKWQQKQKESDEGSSNEGS